MWRAFFRELAIFLNPFHKNQFCQWREAAGELRKKSRK
jgi:hypothetical protein